MNEECVLVMDCGATTTRAVAVDARGNLVANASRPSSPSPQPDSPGDGRIWDLKEVWRKLSEASREVCRTVSPSRIKGVTVVTFGADGAPLKRDGSLAYPVISWQCQRTREFIESIKKQLTPQEIYEITGYQIIGFNTLLKWMWLRKYAPEALAEGNRWVMMSGLLAHRLSEEMMIEPTAACTTMAMDIRRRDWSERMLSLVGLDRSFFPPWSQPGDVVGRVTKRASEETGLPEGIPVIAGGHDTQFAPYGSGAKPGDAILSTGTWEIVLLRTDRYEPSQIGFEDGLIIECDAKPGWWNPQVLMIASGVIEWVRRNFFAVEAERGDIHRLMIEEAKKVEPGAGGVMVVPSFVEGTGPAKKRGVLGSISGLTLSTTRRQVYRAVVEGLCYQLRQALEILSGATGFTPTGIRVVGGSAKNELWNQTRADVTGLPAAVSAAKEATVLGAAAFAFKGAGLFTSPEEFMAGVDLGEEIYQPSGRTPFYERGYEDYLRTIACFAK
ncbi:MAG: FGGY family carbohydrate kinase [bacterium]|nr:FGGY family carbohydrate kinase [bacterium]